MPSHAPSAPPHTHRCVYQLEEQLTWRICISSFCFSLTSCLAGSASKAYVFILPSHWILVRLSSSRPQSRSLFADEGKKIVKIQSNNNNILEKISPIHVLIPGSGLASGEWTESWVTGWAALAESSLPSAGWRQKAPLSGLPRRMNLLGPWAPHSLPLAVRAPMTLWRSAVLGMTTSCVFDMEGWSTMRMPSGKHWLEAGDLGLDTPDDAPDAAAGGSFCWKGNFLLLRIRGLLGLRLMVIRSVKKLLVSGVRQTDADITQH